MRRAPSPTLLPAQPTALPYWPALQLIQAAKLDACGDKDYVVLFRPSHKGEVTMRFVMHISLPAEKFNQAVLDGTAGQKLGRILDDAQPEAAYFCAKDGKRGGFLIVNLSDASELPRFAEPWFLNFDATVEFLPAMTPQDLQRAGLDQLGKKWQ